MSKRLYEYVCDKCDVYFSLYREEDERRHDGECPHCKQQFDGEKSKRICVAPEIRFAQGKVKGRMNSRANW